MMSRHSAVHALVFLPVFMLTACFLSRYMNADVSVGVGVGVETYAEPENSAVPSGLEVKPFDIWEDNPEDFCALVGDPPAAGEPFTLIFLPAGGEDASRYAGMKAALLNAESGKRLASAPFFDWRLDGEGHTVKACVIAPPSTFDGGAVFVRIDGIAGEQGAAPFEIPLRERRYTSEEIPLNPANTALRTVPDPKKTAESEQLWAIISRSGGDVYADGPFTPPVAADTRRTSVFGSRRIYRYSNGKSDTAVHAGIDYGVPAGTPVKACAAGKIVLARARIVTGNSVIIEHLPGVYSIYYHLDKILAEEGALAAEGDVIGLSGATGLATGPHLHWEMRAAAENADPDVFCAKPVLDGEAAKKLINERGAYYAELSM
jgi:murein DD-endopeptidase MepM/ murein hydrolase activator NlpD